MMLGPAALMGPFTLADLIGLDVVHAMSRTVDHDRQPSPRPHPVLRRPVG